MNTFFSHDSLCVLQNSPNSASRLGQTAPESLNIEAFLQISLRSMCSNEEPSNSTRSTSVIDLKSLFSRVGSFTAPRPRSRSRQLLRPCRSVRNLPVGSNAHLRALHDLLLNAATCSCRVAVRLTSHIALFPRSHSYLLSLVSVDEKVTS